MTGYAVIWQEGAGPVCSGQLRFLSSRLLLEGISREGGDALTEVAPAEVTRVDIVRSLDGRLDGRPTVVVERSSGASLLIASATGLGMLHEIVDRIGAARRNGQERHATRPDAPRGR